MNLYKINEDGMEWIKIEIPKFHKCIPKRPRIVRHMYAHKRFEKNQDRRWYGIKL